MSLPAKLLGILPQFENMVANVQQTLVNGLTISLQKNEIENLQKAHDVDVSVETRIGRITVHGLIEDVMNAPEKVHQMIWKACTEAIQQEKQAAEMMAAMVEWCFLDASSIPSKLQKYPSNINLQLEKALRKQEPKTSFCDSQGVKYIVDFTTYEEYLESDPSDSVKVIRKSKIDGLLKILLSVYFSNITQRYVQCA